MRRLVLILILCSAAASATTGDDHLLAGARLFREGNFRQAYIEFGVAARLGAGADAAWYSAAALVKLGRAEEAISAFAVAERTAPGARDALLDYYRALACYDARLYLCARGLLEGVAARGGPRLAAQSRQIGDAIAAALAAPPSTGALDWYHQRGAEALTASKGALAAAYFEEAAALALLRSDGYRRAQALAGIAAARALPVQAAAREKP